MKEFLEKSIADLSQENRQDDNRLSENIGKYCQWIQKASEVFNALNHFDQSQVDDQVKQLQNRKDKSGKLFGVPLVIKDNISIEDWPTTAASKMLAGYRAPYNATVIDRLKEAGAVFIGRGNMDEFAMGSSGENSACGVSRNPWNKDMVPGGSSSGSAIAAAIGLGVGALGSDTGGSIRLPASFCGVIGVKPTYGRVSRYGLLALGSSLDQIGPLTRRVEDAAMILEVMAGVDDKDSTTENQSVEEYSKNLNRGNTKLRVGLIEEMYKEADPGVKEVMDDVIEKLAESGIEVKKVNLPMVKYSIPIYYIIQASECSANLARYDGIRFGYDVSKEHEIADLMQQYCTTRQYGFGDEVKRRIMLGTYSLSSGYYDDYFKKAAKVRTKLIEDFNELFTDFDVLLGMTAPTTAFKIGEKINNPLSMYLTDIMTIAVSMAGLPAISVPAGFSQSMPVGVQLIGPMWSEQKLFQLAYLLEKKYEWDKNIPHEIKSMLEE